jgi:hypothetical protein
MVEPELPALTSSAIWTVEARVAREDYPLTREGDWLHAIASTEGHARIAEENLNRATRVLYALLRQHTPCVLLPTVQEREEQRMLIAYAVRHSAFEHIRLTPPQLEQVESDWLALSQEESQWLIIAVAIAELKQKWYMLLRTLHTPEQHLPRLYKSIGSLPALDFIERQRTHTQVLRTACRQLVVQNPTLMPPMDY